MGLEKVKELLKNFYVKIKFYTIMDDWDSNTSEVVFIMDEGYHKTHPGLVDRFKAIVGVYYLAKKADKNFKLYFKVPFDLEKYLVPATVNWKISKGEWCRNFIKTKIFTYNVKKGIPRFKKSHNYHCYYYFGHNILRELNVPQWEKEWHRLFNELFSCSKYLQSLLDRYLPKEEYVAVHFRFVNALEKFEDGFDNCISESQQNELIDNCLNALIEIRAKEKKPICVFSDSSRFLSVVRNKDFLVLDGFDSIGHISFSNSDIAYDKTFVDFFAIANSQKVYAVHGSVLYDSVYPQYAAIVGDKDFEIYNLKIDK